MNKSTSFKKGLALELRLAELFKKNDYDVIHNIKRVGRSGVEHQIDVMVEYRCPLHTSQVIIEAKSYESPINKDWIMKLIHIVNDLGVDRGIIVTTSYFTPEAIKTAEGYNIDLWDRDRLVKSLGEIVLDVTKRGILEKPELSKLIVRYNLTIEEAENQVINKLQERTRRGFLGRGKIIEQLDSINLQYIPFYEAEIEFTITEEEKTGLLSKRKVQKIVTIKINFDAISGNITKIIENKKPYPPYLFLKNLNEDEIKVFKAMRDKSWYDTNSVIGLGYSSVKARRILNGLKTIGAIETKRGKRGKILYRPISLFPYDLRIFGSLSDIYETRKYMYESDAQFVEPKINASDVIMWIESF